jgi:hypothetical protein
VPPTTAHSFCHIARIDVLEAAMNTQRVELAGVTSPRHCRD